MPSPVEPDYASLTAHLPEPNLVPLPRKPQPSAEAALARAQELYDDLSWRRSVRHFSPDPVPRALIELAIRTAGTAPSGAHRQPWRFVAISDPALKARLREVIEVEEYRTYSERLPAEWREALHPLGTNHIKAHITEAPWVVVLFAEQHGLGPHGEVVKNYYVTESVSIAAGFFLAAVHRAGLCSLTHTPNPMNPIRELLGRGPNERALLVMPVGHPAANAQVPQLERLPLDAICDWREGPESGEADSG